jgi:hypothetical protein
MKEPNNNNRKFVKDEPTDNYNIATEGEVPTGKLGIFVLYGESGSVDTCSQPLPIDSPQAKKLLATGYKLKLVNG